MQDTRQAYIVAAAMQKGGVGKTTSVYHLARAAAHHHGLRVLVVDFDSQGNTTRALAQDDLAEDDVSIADAVDPNSDISLRDVLVPTIWDNVTLAPVSNTQTFTRAEHLLTSMPHGREYRLRETLQPVTGDFDLILIDNAPALGLSLVNALAAANTVLVVMEAEQFSLDGLAELRRTVEQVRHYYNQQLQWSGVLLNRWRNTRDEKDRLSEVRELFPLAEVWDKETVPLWSSIKTTMHAGKGLDQSKEAKLRILSLTYARIVSRLLGDRVEAVA